MQISPLEFISVIGKDNFESLSQEEQNSLLYSANSILGTMQTIELINNSTEISESFAKGLILGLFYQHNAHKPKVMVFQTSDNFSDDD